MDHHNHGHHMVMGESNAKEYVKFFLVISGIVVAAYGLMMFFGEPSGLEFMRWFMGVFFATFGIFKLIGYKMFADMFASYDVVAKRFKLYAHLYPFIELALAALYLTNSFSGIRDVITLVIMATGVIGIFQEIKKRSGIHCACLGNVIKLPLSTVSLIEDIGMGLMALVMLLIGMR